MEKGEKREKKGVTKGEQRGEKRRGTKRNKGEMFAVFLFCVLRARYDLLLDTEGLCITQMSLC